MLIDRRLTWGSLSLFVVLALLASAAPARAAPLSTAPANDESAGAVVFTSLPYSATQDTTGATQGGSDPTDCLSGHQFNSVWYKFSPSAMTYVTLNTYASTYDTNITVYEGTITPAAQVACNDDHLANRSRVNFFAYSGTDYYIYIAAWAAGGGTLHLNARFNPPGPTDFDGDRYSDAATFGATPNTLWHRNSSNQLWSGVYAGPGTLQYVPRSRFDGDLITDPSVFDSGANTLWTLLSLGPPIWLGTYMGLGSMVPVPGSDFDGDGLTDAAQFSLGTNTLWYYASSSPGWVGFYMGPGGYQIVPGSDFDGDHKADFAKFDGTNSLWYFGSTDVTWHGVYMGSGGYVYVPASDLDGDTVTDPAVFDNSTNTLWFQSSAEGTVLGIYVGPGTVEFVAASDFDGDGQTDAATFNASSGALWFLESNYLPNIQWSGMYLGPGSYSVAN